MNLPQINQDLQIPSASSFNRLVTRQLLELQRKEQEREIRAEQEQEFDDLLEEFSSPAESASVENNQALEEEQMTVATTSKVVSSSASSNSAQVPSIDEDVNVDYVYIGNERYQLDDDNAYETSTSSDTDDDLYGMFSDDDGTSNEDDDGDDGDSSSQSTEGTSRGISADQSNSISSIEAEAQKDKKRENPVEQKFSVIALKHNLKHTAANDILEFLQKLRYDVCCDSRTLLGTTRDTSDDSFER